MASVIINDYLVNRRAKLFFLPDDYDFIDRQWDNVDQVLLNLQRVPAFKGRTRWSELQCSHFRILIAKTLSAAADLSEEDRVDDDNPIVSSLNFYICGLIRCFERSVEVHVELLRINRVGKLETSVEFTAAMQMEQPIGTKSRKSDPFSVIVDNTSK